MSPAPSSWKVLVVEDDADSREVLGELIRVFGHTALPVADVTEALNAAGKYEPEFALIDISLPGVDGCEVARRLRRLPCGPTMRLVALTGFSDAALRATASAVGFDDFWVKPIVPETLNRLLQAGRA